MTRFTLVLATVIFASGLAGAKEYRYILFNKYIEVSITSQAVKPAPAWDDNANNPPLSAREALTIAKKEWDRIERTLIYDRNAWTWKLRSISLTPASGDGWYWLAVYDGKMPGVDVAGALPEVHIPILMDGRIGLRPIRDAVADDYLGGGP